MLISSAGRRVGLTRLAGKAAAEFGGSVIATDAHPAFSAACQVADQHFMVPPIMSEGFLPATLKIARENHVGVIIPTLDTELLAFSMVRDEWATEAIHVSISDSGLVRRCRDKRATVELFTELGIESPRVLEDDSAFPRFVKPVGGSLSQDIHIVHSPEAYDPRLKDRTRYIHQEVVDRSRYVEFTVDALYDIGGLLKCLVPRRRIEVRGGEVSKGITEKGPLLEYLVERMGQLPGARGCLTAQFFAAKAWEGVPVPVLGVEVNARFGGGYPLTDRAGGHYVQWIVEEALQGRQATYSDAWLDGLMMLRYDEEVFIL